ncbi:MAG: hypothetical protein AAGD38_18305 [Acidobacteriota bacterium]
MTHIAEPFDLLAYVAEVDWENRLHLAMDRVEDALFDYPARAVDMARQLPELFAIYPARVTAVHHLRADALETTALGLVSALDEANKTMAELLLRARQLSDLPEDLGGWLHAKYASMLIRLRRFDEAFEVIDKGLELLNLKTPEVMAARAQLEMCHGMIYQARCDWMPARRHYEIAYRLVNHRDEIKGGYYRRGDITKTAAMLNLVAVTAAEESDPVELLAFLDRAKIKARHNIRSYWGFAPYHEVATTDIIGRLQLNAKRFPEALVNLEFAARGFLRLGLRLEALDTTLYLVELEPKLQTVDQVFRTIERDRTLSDALIQLVKDRAFVHQPELRNKVRAEIAAIREQRGQIRVAA